jgi:hypothetical protein
MKKETSIETIRTLKTGNCSSRSGKSKLTYLIGCDPEAKIHFRIHSNTGNGFFNNGWIPLENLLELLSKSGGAFTSFALYPLLKGKSNNTPAFIIAALLEEGFIHRSESQALLRFEQFEHFSGSNQAADGIQDRHRKRAKAVEEKAGDRVSFTRITRPGNSFHRVPQKSNTQVHET